MVNESDKLTESILDLLRQKKGHSATATYIAQLIYGNWMIDSNDKEYRRVLKRLNKLQSQGIISYHYINRHKAGRWKIEPK